MQGANEKQAAQSLGARIWQGLRDAVVETEPPRLNPVPQAKNPAVQSDAANPRPEQGGAGGAPASKPVQASPMFTKLMGRVLDKASAYTALSEKLQPLEGIVLDERIRYQAAFALIKATRSAEQVVQAIDLQHLPALESEVAQFCSQLKDKEQADVGARQNLVQTLTAQISTAEAQITRLRADLETRVLALQQDMQKDQAQMAQAEQEAQAQSRERAQVQAQFDAAANGVKDVLVQAKTKVLAYVR